MADTTATTEITFETGYDRLKAIAERIDQEEVPVAELCELFAEGKGLEHALTGYLDTQKSRLEKIERGEGVQAFRIVAVSADDTTAEPASETDIGDLEFEPASVGPTSGSSVGREDIPF